MATKQDLVAGDLRRAIAAGEIAPGAKLPTEPELMERYGVARATVRLAIARLRDEGLVVAQQGRGTFVSEPDQPMTLILRHSPSRLSKAERDLNRSAHHHDAMHRDSGVTTRVYFERADAKVAEQLGIDEGDEVCVRDRVMQINGEPTQLAVSRLPREITRETLIEQENTGDGGLLARLEELGFTPANPIEHVTVSRATSDEARELSVPAGDPLFKITRVQPDESGRVLEINEMTLVKRYELIYEIPIS